MSCTHPLLDVDDIFDLPRFLSSDLSILLHDTFWLVITLEVTPEMLEKGNLLLKLFRIFSKSVLLSYILAIT
jgi:hypothetical protein